MLIQNRGELDTTESRHLVLDLVEAGLRAIDTADVIKSVVSLQGDTLKILSDNLKLSSFGRLLVVAVGKCAIDASLALEAILADRISAGLAIDVRDPDKDRPLRHIRCLVGDHPYPTERNISASKELVKLLGGVGERDLVLMVISGGGSTLLCHPQNHTCEDEKQIVAELFRSGATIQELNVVRKHLSLVRGGYLAKHAYPSQVVGLIFSDVPGDDISVVASGPTAFDQTTVDDAKAIVDQYHLVEKINFDYRHLMETPKEERYFAKVKNYLVVSNQLALVAMCRQAESAGYQAVVRDTRLTGEASLVAARIVSELRQQKSGTVLLYGGETTVNLTGHGLGGRNQELALAALPLLADDELVLSLASDGYDNTDAAAGIADSLTRRHAVDKSLDVSAFLTDNDSYTFFKESGDQVLTGKTGANVSDLIIAVKS